jgi:hypothetical protein
MRFAIGQKVICIRDHPEWRERGCEVPKIGKIYTVRAYDDIGGLLLTEIVNEIVGEFSIDAETGQKVPLGEDSFIPHRFRPLVERRTDISIFRRILDRANCRQRRTAQKQA